MGRLVELVPSDSLLETGSLGDNDRLSVLFLCTGNSCRSQMAEGWTRHLKSRLIRAGSAGTSPGRLNEWAVRVMAESGVDISHYWSKDVRSVLSDTWDVVVTVCGHAHESCPTFPGTTRVVHRGFSDPPRLAETARSEEEALDHYRRVRDEIRRYVETLPEALTE